MARGNVRQNWRGGQRTVVAHPYVLQGRAQCYSRCLTCNKGPSGLLVTDINSALGRFRFRTVVALVMPAFRSGDGVTLLTAGV